jgi:hypothetical protein
MVHLLEFLEYTLSTYYYHPVRRNILVEWLP